MANQRSPFFQGSRTPETPHTKRRKKFSTTGAVRPQRRPADPTDDDSSARPSSSLGARGGERGKIERRPARLPRARRAALRARRGRAEGSFTRARRREGVAGRAGRGTRDASLAPGFFASRGGVGFRPGGDRRCLIWTRERRWTSPSPSRARRVGRPRLPPPRRRSTTRPRARRSGCVFADPTPPRSRRASRRPSLASGCRHDSARENNSRGPSSLLPAFS